MKSGTIMVLSDTHCGGLGGLTPPQFDSKPEGSEAALKLYDARRGMWRWFSDEKKKVGKVDYLLGLGDLTEGAGKRNAGRDCLTSDPVEQVRMAASVVKGIDAPSLIVRGTPYHVGDEANYEDLVGDYVDALRVEDDLWATVFGVTIYARHKIGKSGVPNGFATQLAKETVWKVLKSETEGHPRPDLMLYAHTHEFTVLEKWGVTAVQTPGLQLPGTEYGRRGCSGSYDVGFIVIRVNDGEIKVEKRMYAEILPEVVNL